MPEAIDILECYVLEMQQESARRLAHFAKEAMGEWYITEQRVGLELNQVLRQIHRAISVARRETGEAGGV